MFLHHFIIPLSFLTISLAHTYSSTSLPSPQEDPTNICRRGSKKSVVCDPDGYLSESDADTIDGLANFIEQGSHGFKQLKCANGQLQGAQIAVAIFGSMPYGFGKAQQRAYQFAKDLHDRWGVGDAQCQNGVVIVLAVEDRGMGFSIGRGVNGIFTDDLLPMVMDDMKPMLRKKEYGKALQIGVTDIGNILSGNVLPETSDGILLSIAAPFFFMFMVLYSCTCCANRGGSRYQRCKKLLKKIDKERTRASDNVYVATSCPICLEDFCDSDTNTNNNQNTNISRNSDETTALSSTNTVTRTAGLAQTPTTAPQQESSTSPEDPTENVTRILPCGHKFHEKCIVEWFAGTEERNRLCPICRQPILEHDDDSILPRTNYGRPSGWDVYDPEYSFRMQRAHHYYPDYITWNMMNSWERDRYRRDRPMANSSAFVAVDPAVVAAAAARSSGGGGSSFSFGGGSSAGGGGGGGGW